MEAGNLVPGVEEAVRNWAEMPTDVLREIAGRIQRVEDYMRFASVCKSWYSPLRRWECPKPSKPLPGYPWLMLVEEEGGAEEEQGECVRKKRGFYSLYNGKQFNLDLPESCGRACYGSSCGWLLTLGLDLEMHLLNPITREKLPLPSQTTFPHQYSPKVSAPEYLRLIFIYKVFVIYDDPVAATKDRRTPIVFVIYSQFRLLAMARPGDSSWTPIPHPSVDKGFFDVSSFRDQVIIFNYKQISICHFSESPPRLEDLCAAPLRGYDSCVVDLGGELYTLCSDGKVSLSLTVLAAFCRVPKIASSEDMVSKVPLVLEVMLKEGGSPVLQDCYEFLFLVSSASETGAMMLLESGGIRVLSNHISTLTDGSHLLGLAIKLLHLMLSKVSAENISNEDFSAMVPAIARQFAVLHDALKFEAFHLLCAVLPGNSMALLHDALPLMQDDLWPTYVRVGIVDILQNRVAPAEKFQALLLAEAMISILGEGWLIGELALPGVQDSTPPDRCILLVLESSRVEIAVLLNELAYLKYEASKESSPCSETIRLKQRNLGIGFTLVEKIIKLISRISDDGGDLISGNTFTKVICGFNDTIGVVLEYLQDAKEHGQNKGDDLLASVRIVGSYLAEAPLACREKVRELLEFMLSVEGDDEPSPFYSICFLLPMLCQVTMEPEGCGLLAYSKGYKSVVTCLIKFIQPKDHIVEDKGSVFLACDTIMNLLLKREQMRHYWDDTIFAKLLKALVYWADSTDEPSISMMSSTLCALILGYTSEEALVKQSECGPSIFQSLGRLICRSFVMSEQDMSNDAGKDDDLHAIVVREYSQWAHRFPHIKEVVGR